MGTPLSTFVPCLLGLLWGLAALAAGAQGLALWALILATAATVPGLVARRRRPWPRGVPARVVALETAFPHDYDVELADGATPDAVIRLPSGGDGREGTLLRITPRNGTAWDGFFRGFRPGRDRLLATPHERRLLVATGAEAYVVPVDRPAGTKTLPIAARGLFPVPARGLIVAHDLAAFEAYGRDGLVWRSARVSWDGLTVTRVTDDVIEGTATDLQDREIPFRLDLATGRHEGGSWPGREDESRAVPRARRA